MSVYDEGAMRTVEAVIDERGAVRLLEAVEVVGELSEAALAQDWNRPEEDAAWSRLQPES